VIGTLNALKFIYQDWNFDDSKIKTEGFGAIDNFYKNQSEKFGYEITYDAGTYSGESGQSFRR